MDEKQLIEFGFCEPDYPPPELSFQIIEESLNWEDLEIEKPF